MKFQSYVFIVKLKLFLVIFNEIPSKRWRRKAKIILVFLAVVLVLFLLIPCARKTFVINPNKEEKQVITMATHLLFNRFKFKPWYFEGGLSRPNFFNETIKLWPEEAEGDRILDQLMFIPKSKPKFKKKIYFEGLNYLEGQNIPTIFDISNCPVNNCEIVYADHDADAVVFKDFVKKKRTYLHFKQIWVLYTLESPFKLSKVIQHNSINWTASYRLNSDLVTPYDKWVYYNENNKAMDPIKNYAAGKINKVAWFVSNCYSKNKRLEYAKNLQKYIAVDIYGACGKKICFKGLDIACENMISTNYKFYLAFENANCRDYITEKFFRYGLRLDVIPIVMGAPKKDYQRVAPLNSFIHVEDFSSPKHLAEYLHFLDNNDAAYNSYFQWKGTGEFINTFFICRLCGLLHANRPIHYYRKLTQWWKNSESCTKSFWNKTNEKKILMSLKKKKGMRENVKIL